MTRLFFTTLDAESAGKLVTMRWNFGTVVLEVYRSVLVKCIWAILN